MSTDVEPVVHDFEADSTASLVARLRQIYTNDFDGSGMDYWEFEALLAKECETLDAEKRARLVEHGLLLEGGRPAAPLATFMFRRVQAAFGRV